MTAIPCRRAMLAAALPAPALLTPAKGVCSTGTLETDRELVTLHAELVQRESLYGKAVEAMSAAEGTPGEAATEASAAVAWDACLAVMFRMADVPARGAAGFAVKALQLTMATRNGASAADGALAASVTRDAMRLGLYPREIMP